MRVAMLGTRGVPARYGGFETAVEEVGRRLASRGHDVIVYCRNPGQSLEQYRGMTLVNVPALRKRALETLSHTGLSAIHAIVRRVDAAIVFNAGNAPYLPILRACGIPTAVHMDGLEWQRAKWSGLGSRYYKWAEARAARSNCALIADARGIADYLVQNYGRDSFFIPYGAPQLNPGCERLPVLKLSPGEFHLVVARMEPENHVDMIVDGYGQSTSSVPLVVVGTGRYGRRYDAHVRAVAGKSDVRFVGSIWDQDLLNELYAHCRSYLHGHSVGGTNPSLLRALGCGAPVTAYDVIFNREVTSGHARFFRTARDVAKALEEDDREPWAARARGARGKSHVAATYNWDDVADRYERMLKLIA